MKTESIMFKPKDHLPKLPRPNVDNCHEYYNYAFVAWYAYWTWVLKTADRWGWDISRARKWVHARGQIAALPDSDEFPDWSTTDILIAFMSQFPVWQKKSYDLNYLRIKSQMYDHLPNGGEIDWYAAAQKGVPVDTLMRMMSWEELESLPTYLVATDRIDDLKNLCDDPIYGAEARLEVKSYEWSMSFAADEVFRRSAMPEKIQKLDFAITRDRDDGSCYALMYPYDKVQFGKKVHDFEDCLCVLVDGACCFRLQVLDTKTFNMFRLVELRPPWWSMSPAITEHGFKTDPETAEYDFPFPEFGVQEGDELTYEKLVDILEEGRERINSRHTRKLKWRNER